MPTVRIYRGSSCSCMGQINVLCSWNLHVVGVCTQRFKCAPGRGALSRSAALALAN